MKLFEVILAPGASAGTVLSQEVLDETGAQLFTEEEAKLVGLEGIPDNPGGDTRMFIACSPSDGQFVATRLEAAAAVARFKLHDV